MSRLLHTLRRVVRVAAPALSVVGAATFVHQASATSAVAVAPAKLVAPADATTAAVSPHVARAREIIAASGSPQVVTGDIRTDMVALIHRVQDEICAVRAQGGGAGAVLRACVRVDVRAPLAGRPTCVDAPPSPLLPAVADGHRRHALQGGQVGPPRGGRRPDARPAGRQRECPTTSAARAGITCVTSAQCKRGGSLRSPS